MKVQMFSALLEMVQKEFGPDCANQIREKSQLVDSNSESDDYGELSNLLEYVSTQTGKSLPDLYQYFGRMLVQQFAATSAESLTDVESSFELLSRIDEIVKLTGDSSTAEDDLPTFGFKAHDGGCMEITCRSTPSFGNLANGLIRACAEYFGEEVSVDRHNVTDGQGRCARFLLRREEAELSAV